MLVFYTIRFKRTTVQDFTQAFSADLNAFQEFSQHCLVVEEELFKRQKARKAVAALVL